MAQALFSRIRPVKALTVGVAVALALATTACGSSSSGDSGGTSGETITLRFSSHVPDNAAVSQGIVHWMDAVTEATDGQVEFETYWNGSLLPGEELLNGLQDGRADVGWLAGLYYPNEMPLTLLGALPFVVTDPGVQTAALGSLYEDSEAFATEWQDNGVRPVFFTPVGPQIIGTSDPVDSVSDFADKRIRAVSFMGEALKEVDATPVGLAAAEVYESVDRGVIDGYGEMPFDAAVTSYSMQEVAPHIIEYGGGTYSPLALAISETTWSDLPEDVQTAMVDATTEYREFALDDLTKAEDTACETLYEAGGAVTVLPEEEQEAWAESALPVVTESWMEAVTSAGGDEGTAEATLDSFKSIVEEESAGSDHVLGTVRCAESQ